MARLSLVMDALNRSASFQPHGLEISSAQDYNLDMLEHHSLALCPEGKHNLLFQAHSEASASTFLQKELGERNRPLMSPLSCENGSAITR